MKGHSRDDKGEGSINNIKWRDNDDDVMSVRRRKKLSYESNFRGEPIGDARSSEDGGRSSRALNLST